MLKPDPLTKVSRYTIGSHPTKGELTVESSLKLAHKLVSATTSPTAAVTEHSNVARPAVLHRRTT